MGDLMSSMQHIPRPGELDELACNPLLRQLGGLC